MEWRLPPIGAISAYVMDFRVGCCLLCLVACAPQTGAPSATPATQGAESSAAGDSPGPATGAAQADDGTDAGATTATSVPERPALDEADQERLRLPEVVVENVGLHIGGASNDAESKRRFIKGLERVFESFRWCYRFVDKPGGGGVFGVDLLVPRDGQGAEVRDVRTGMAGEEFKGCMVAAFSEAVFEAPGRPVVFSYSLRFSVKEPTGVQ